MPSRGCKNDAGDSVSEWSASSAFDPFALRSAGCRLAAEMTRCEHTAPQRFHDRDQ